MSDTTYAADPTGGPVDERPQTWKYAVGALAVAVIAFVVIAFGGLGENLVYYWTPSDLVANGTKAQGATIRLGGMVKKGSYEFVPGATEIEFDVTDGAQTVHVKSKGLPPQMMRDNIGVVVEGTMTAAGHFESSRLMVAHDNEYRAKEGEEGYGDGTMPADARERLLKMAREME